MLGETSFAVFSDLAINSGLLFILHAKYSISAMVEPSAYLLKWS